MDTIDRFIAWETLLLQRKFRKFGQNHKTVFMVRTHEIIALGSKDLWLWRWADEAFGKKWVEWFVKSYDANEASPKAKVSILSVWDA